MTARLLDARQTLALDLNGIKLIEASAGTGKTYTISNLFCRYIIAGVSLQNILLVTFTNAASDELKHRIRLRLHTALSLFKKCPNNLLEDDFLKQLRQQFESLDESDKTLWLNRLTLAMRSFDEAAIHTINGFCQRMLSDFAFNSAQHYECTLIQNDAELWQKAINDWWRTHSYTLTEQRLALFNRAVNDIQTLIKHSQTIYRAAPQIITPAVQSMDDVYVQWEKFCQQLQAFKKNWQSEKNAIIDFFNEHDIFKKKSAHGMPSIQQNLARLDDDLMQHDVYLLTDCFIVLCDSFIKKNILKKYADSYVFLQHDLFKQADILWQQHNTLIHTFTISALMNARNFAQQQTLQAKLKQHSMTFDDQLSRLHDALIDSQGVLAKTIKKQFPVALIDEFQDTNAIQYAIFQHIYANDNKTSLIMIGDPKQAIYSFRGGDIFTYLAAKQQVGKEVFSLNRNWRSTPQLINAINHFFKQRPDAFIYADTMPFEAVLSGTEKTPDLSRNNIQQQALSLWHLPSELDLNLKSATKLINHHVANEICCLINEGDSGQALLGKQPVKAADIAILVRTNHEGKALAEALKQRGVASINIGKDKVLQSDAAKGLLLLLTGIAEVDNAQSVRNMLASRLLMYSPLEINAIVNDETQWIDWLSNVNDLHGLWLKEGFVVMFYRLLRLLNISEALTKRDDSERQITNLLHCVEIIQHAAKTYTTPHTLCTWFKQQINQPELNGDEDELRLESDAQLVKIVTIHKSKGLEYPIVFIPFLWKSKPVSKSALFYLYHNQQQHKVCSFITQKKPELSDAFIQADKERLAEDMRLLYVALTRAKSKCYLVTAHIARSNSQFSALSFLCHSAQSAQDLTHKQADISKYAKKHDLALELDTLAKNSANTIGFTRLNKSAQWVKSKLALQTKAPIYAANFTGKLNLTWQISSFSRMTRDIHQVAHGGHTHTTNDDILNFKRGGDAGTFLHHILELLDFSKNVSTQSHQLFKRFAARYHLDTEQNAHTVAHWMKQIVNTTLNDDGFTLSMLSRKQRLDELEFDFSLDTVDIPALNTFLSQRTGQSGPMLSVASFKGMMTGFIDLVFEHKGKYYIADYKSNFLGTQLGDYHADKLQQAIIDRRYDLQYLLYSLALHRYLRYRLPNYHYATHFGGVYYLFLRAMRQKTGHQFGVFFDCPTAKEMDTLDTILFKIGESS